MGFKSYAAPSAQGIGPVVSPSTAGAEGPGGWHPTVLYMLGLVIAEIIIVGFLARTVLK